MTRSPLTPLGLLALLVVLAASAAQAQIGGYLPFGANHPEVDWFEISTEHFRIIYHEGLEQESREAAAIAEAIYPVVTGNLDQPIDGRTPIYLSDLDDIGNALALGDKYIYVWMRGIVGDGGYGGLRAGGRTKWMRTVITHEFTHIVVDEATSFFNLFGFAPPNVPRWFNEGVARAMEPDGWTSDIDQVVRMAVVTDKFKKDMGYDLFNLGPLDGHLLYEGGQAFVRYLIWTYGDSVIPTILHNGRGIFGYSFPSAVKKATGKSLSDVQKEWLTALEGTYDSAIATGDRIVDRGRRIPTGGIDAVGWAVASPEGGRVAFVGGKRWKPQGVHLARIDRDDVDGITTEPGIEPVVSWHPDGASLLVAKSRHASDRSLTHDIYRLSLDGDLDRITTDADVSDPASSPNVGEIVAVRTVEGRDNLVRIDLATGALTPLTSLTDDVQMHTPSWSPDGSRIAFGMFDARGHRVIAVVESDGSNLRTIVDDTANNRYPLWSPDGTRIAFTSHASGVPNIVTVAPDGSDRREITRLSDGAYATGWTPSGDSIIVIAIESPDRIIPYLLPAEQPQRAPMPGAGRYDGWRGAMFGLTIPAAGDEVAEPRIEMEKPYVSFAGVKPIIPFFPLFGSDIITSQEGFPMRIGWLTLWFDPLFAHQIIAYADYGISSETLGGELYYLNNTLPISIATHLDFSVGLNGVIPGNSRTRGDIGYYQRTSGGSMTASLWLPDQDALDISHEFQAGGEFTQRTPLGRAIEALDLGVSHSVFSLELGYNFTSPGLLFSGSYDKSLAIADDGIAYDRLQAHASARIPLIGPFSLVTTGHAVAQMGEQLPYEFVGLHRYDIFTSNLGFSYRDLFNTNLNVRGVNEWIFGDRAVVGSAGLRTDLTFLNRPFPFLAPYRLNLHLFADVGSAWFADESVDPPLAVGYGAELRMPYLLNLQFALGAAHGRIDDVDLGVEVYVRFGWGF